MKDGSVLSVGKLPMSEPHKVFYTWSILFERSATYRSKHRYSMLSEDPSGGGRTLREAFKKLRLKLALDQSYKLRETHKKVAKRTATDDYNERMSREPW